MPQSSLTKKIVNFLKNICGFTPRYETDQLLHNYLQAQYGPYLPKDPTQVSEDFYQQILAIAKKYIVKGDRALDIGCATGRLVFEYDNLGAESFGIDLSKNFISFCNQAREGLIKNISYSLFSKKTVFIADDIFNTSFDQPFTFISIINVIDRVEDPNALVSKVRSLLKDSGVALWVDPYDWDRSPAPKSKQVNDMKELFDQKDWKVLEETHIPFVMPISSGTVTYDCHVLVTQRIY